MYTYNQNQLLNYFSAVLQRNLTADAWNWLIETTGKISTGDNAALFTAFSSAHRRTGKNTLQINKDEIEGIAQLVDNFSLHGYTAERLARVWVLLHWPTEDRENYIKAVSELFKAAEMNELVALYGALPLFPFPEAWTAQCSEGIRSNIGSVLETVICNNPYPANYLSEPAWNQMVLKAFFTDKAVEQIIGLDERANKALADTLFDYAHERWAAHRTFDLQLWRLLSKFIDAQSYADAERVLRDGSDLEQKAVALACSNSNYHLAKALLNSNPNLKSSIDSAQLTWNSLAMELKGEILI